eukprot:scaffold7141_cov107-Isochrysis_galbana.AAC.4
MAPERIQCSTTSCVFRVPCWARQGAERARGGKISREGRAYERTRACCCGALIAGLPRAVLRTGSA